MGPLITLHMHFPWTVSSVGICHMYRKKKDCKAQEMRKPGNFYIDMVNLKHQHNYSQNCPSLRNRKSNVFTRRFANTRSLKGLRDSVAFAKSQPTPASLVVGPFFFILLALTGAPVAAPLPFFHITSSRS